MSNGIGVHQTGGAGGVTTRTADVARNFAPNSERGRVQLMEPLGAGRHGNVFAGRWTQSDTKIDVAVKVSSDIDALSAEAAALRRFAGAGVVPLIAPPDRANGVLVLARCERGSLADATADGALKLDEARHVAETISGALQRLHDDHHLHGDVNPSNIGVRADGSVVLLDLATVQAADGTPMPSGTSAFSGPHHLATIELDVRCLAATLVATIDETNQEGATAADRLRALVARCDSTDETAVSLGDVVHAVGGSSASPLDVRQPQLTDGQPPSGPITRDYGPRPGGGEEQPAVDEPSSADPGLIFRIAAVGIIVVLAAIWIEIADGSALPPVEPSAASLRSVLTPTESLAAHDGEWNTSTGVLRIELEGEMVRLATGSDGDIAAIADWNCDGEPTLGVYRPATGGWFVFPSWAPTATSSVALLATGKQLAVEFDAANCATPKLI